MIVLVTGGLGVNGAFVTRQLVERGHRVIVVDRQRDVSLLGPAAEKIDLRHTDILDRDAMAQLMTDQKVDAVIHMAALITGIDEDPLKGFMVNGLGAVQLMDAALASGAKRFVYTSSRAVYGNIVGEHAHPTYHPVDEGQPLELGIAIAPLPAFGPARLGHEFDLLVVADGLHLGAGLLRQAADREHLRLHKTYSRGRFDGPLWQRRHGFHMHVTKCGSRDESS